MSTIKPIRFPDGLREALESRASETATTFAAVVRAACALAVGVADSTPATGATKQTPTERAEAARAGGLARAKARRKGRRRKGRRA